MAHRDPCGLAIIITALIFLAGGAPAYDPANGDFTRSDPGHIRVLSYNVLQNFVTDAGLTSGEFTRVLQNIDPDVIAFQEINSSLTASDISTELSTILGDPWDVQLGIASVSIRNALAARHGTRTLGFNTADAAPISDTVPASEVRGVTAGLVGLAASPDLYVMTVHFKAFPGATESARRQTHADAIINWMRDARTPGYTTLPSGDQIDLASGTPMLVVGDMNFVTTGEVFPHNGHTTLLGGDISDETTYGPDSPPDWDGSAASDVAPYDHTNADPRTQPSSGPSGRIDLFIHTDSALTAANRFVLNTATLTGAALASASPVLLAADTANATDHLPCVVDFAVAPSPAPGLVLLNEYRYNDLGTDDAEFVELINVGGQEVNLDAPLDYHHVRSTSPLPVFPPASETEQTDIDLTGVVPAGGLFVLYNTGANSAAVAPSIEAVLPPLQREANGSFVGANANDTGIALVIDTLAFAGSQEDSLVEALMYQDSAADGDHFFRTDSGNGLTITLSSDQRLSSATWTVGNDTSLSRNVGANAPNTLPSTWTAGDVATPGLPNFTPVPVELSVFSSD